ncbi:hypothetical protein SSX86_005587 [Deinandra increscens subsp. villosa]|uniref:F-box associated beta-propeller type 3 domain-containing protein n=1 Tax=Deinandra increscens subsp. villosa TaxID=3103831 RepID=A0AAP0HC19_9ASTR
MHLRYQTNRNQIILLDPSSPRTFTTFDPNHLPLATTQHAIHPFNENNVLIVASRDGLVCVALTETRQLAFWNPLTRAYKTFHTRFYDDLFKFTPMAFYSDSSNDYKFLHVVSVSEGAFIYSGRLDSWRKINICPEIISGGYISNYTWHVGTFSRLKVYFLLQSKRSLNQPRLVSFDVESEEFKEIQFPPVPQGYYYSGLTLATRGGYALWLAYGDRHDGCLKCDLWRMDDDEGDGWIKLMTYSRPFCNGRIVPYKLAYVKKDGDLIVFTQYYTIDTNYFFTHFVCIEPVPWPFANAGAIYTETLVSPHP